MGDYRDYGTVVVSRWLVAVRRQKGEGAFWVAAGIVSPISRGVIAREVEEWEHALGRFRNGLRVYLPFPINRTDCGWSVEGLLNSVKVHSIHIFW